RARRYPTYSTTSPARARLLLRSPDGHCSRLGFRLWPWPPSTQETLLRQSQRRAPTRDPKTSPSPEVATHKSGRTPPAKQAATRQTISTPALTRFRSSRPPPDRSRNTVAP